MACMRRYEVLLNGGKIGIDTIKKLFQRVFALVGPECTIYCVRSNIPNCA